MDASWLPLLGHAPANQLDERILQRGLAFLHAPDLAAGALNHPHDTAQGGVAGELEAKSVDAILLGDARSGHATDRPQRIEQAAARGELEIHDRIPLDLLLELGRRSLGHDAAAIDDRHPVAELIGLHHVVGRQDDGATRVFRHPAAYLVAPIPREAPEPRRSAASLSPSRSSSSVMWRRAA